jgi:hypothetical protein
MRKILPFIFILIFSGNVVANDVIGAGTPWVPQSPNTQWSVTSANELSYDGSEPVGNPAVIATTFDGLTATDTWSYYAGLTLTFDAVLSNNTNDTLSVVLGAKDVWASKRGILIQITKNSAQVVPNLWVAAPVVLSTDATAYQAKVIGNAYNTIKIEVTVDGAIFVTLNGYTCPGAYGAGNAWATPMNTATPANRPALFCTSFAGFKLKNLTAVKAACTPGTGGTGIPTVSVAGGTKTFFTVASGLKNTQKNNALVYPNPTKGSFTVSNQAVGSKYTITNMLGQELKSGNILNTKQTIDLTNEQSGIYLLIIDGKSRKEVTSIIKQ